MPTVQQAVTLMPELIRLDRVSVHLDDRDILKNVDFSLHQNEIVTLIGPNGAGKSTLIKVLLGITHPSQGKVVSSQKNKMAYVPQKFNPSHSLPLRVKDLLDLEKCDRELRNEIVRDTGISKLQDSKVQQLSGGEKQRVLLARYCASPIFWCWMNRCRGWISNPKPSFMNMYVACLNVMVVPYSWFHMICNG